MFRQNKKADISMSECSLSKDGDGLYSSFGIFKLYYMHSKKDRTESREFRKEGRMKERSRKERKIDGGTEEGCRRKGLEK